MPPYGDNRPPPGAPPAGQVPQPRQPSYGPPGGQPGYPAPQGQPGYPAQPGHPAQPGYPPQPGYPAPQPGYPAAQPGYPTPQPGYPVSGQPGYPVPSGPPPGHQYPQQTPGYGYPARPGWPGQPATPTSPGGQPLASFGDRLVAVLIDGAITGAVGGILMIPIFIVYAIWMGSTVGDLETQPDGTITGADAGSMVLPLLVLYVGIFAVSLLVWYVYYVEFTVRRGQTVGKRAMKVKIVTFDPAGTITRGVLVKRYGAQMLCGFVPGLSLLDGLWQLWDKPYQQCLHDKAGRTVVVKVPA